MNLSRRALLTGTAAGLVLSFVVSPQGARAAPPAAPKKAPEPNAFLRIAPDDSVTVILAHSEMGQGIWTGLAMCIAEELGCAWSKVKSEHAPAAPVYGHPLMGIQMTGGSASQKGEFDRYRIVGATAREMLVQAAADTWKVAPSACKAGNGLVTSGTKKATYGELAERAMKLTPPASVKLKEASEWTIIGKPTRRLDGMAKITGKAQFGMDVQMPGLRTAVIARPPAFGSKLQSFDPADALKVPGVEKVVRISNGVAVVAAHYWAAKLGRDALRVTWSDPPDGGVDTVKLVAEWRKKARTPGPVAEQKGDVDAALAKAKTRFEMEYDVPYLAHAPMEPLNCTVKIDGDRCEIWTGTQFQTVDQGAAAHVLGVPPDHVTIHTMFLGGGFGRRANPASDFVVEAVETAKAAGLAVKVVWSREDDLHGGYYRPAYVHRVEVGTDERGMPVAWKHAIVGQSIISGTPFEKFVVKNGIDNSSVEGVTESPYIENLANHRVTLHTVQTPIPVLWFRSVGNTHTAFAMECALDELAHAAKKDPLAYRLELLKDKPRHAAALALAAEKAGWGKPLPAGHGLGLAMHESFGSIIGEVAEVSVERGKIRVHKVTAVIDCGVAVNPMAVEAQIQGSIAFGLSAALYGQLRMVAGKVVETNFHDYQVLRIGEMPQVQVFIQKSTAKMGGVGEPATAPIAPAVANAVFAATKERLRSLPLVPSGSAS